MGNQNDKSPGQRDSGSVRGDSPAPEQRGEGRGQAPAAGPDPAFLAQQLQQRGPAPVHLWDPPYCGEMDLRIARDGTWYHEGRPIRREALVRLFASILKKENGRHYLVTPVEKVGIQVEDRPFLVTGVEVSGSGSTGEVILTLNTGDQVTVDHEHPLWVEQEPDSGQPHPLLAVRGGLEALVSRSVYYRLVEMAQSRVEEGVERFGIWSCGQFFVLHSRPE